MNIKDLLHSINDKNDFELVLTFDNIKYPKIVSDREETIVEKEIINGEKEIFQYDMKASYGEISINNDEGSYVDNNNLIIQWKGYLGNYSAHEPTHIIEFSKNKTKKINHLNTLNSFVNVITALNAFEKIGAKKYSDDGEYDYNFCPLMTLQTQMVENQGNKKLQSDCKKLFNEFMAFIKTDYPEITMKDLQTFSKIIIKDELSQNQMKDLQSIIQQGIKNTNIQKNQL